MKILCCLAYKIWGLNCLQTIFLMFAQEYHPFWYYNTQFFGNIDRFTNKVYFKVCKSSKNDFIALVSGAYPMKIFTLW